MYSERDQLTCAHTVSLGRKGIMAKKAKLYTFTHFQCSMCLNIVQRGCHKYVP